MLSQVRPDISPSMAFVLILNPSRATSFAVKNLVVILTYDRLDTSRNTSVVLRVILAV